MADVELVIKIDEKYFKGIKICVKDGILNYEPWVTIAKGKPLPKGHGDLKDADALDRDLKNAQVNLGDALSEAFDDGLTWASEVASKLPTLIEADKESEGQIVMTFSEMKQAILQAFIDNDDARLQRLKIMDSNMYAEVIKALEMDVVKAEEALNG